MTDSKTKQDARGQFAKSQADRENDGLASATPRAVTGRDDATLENADRKPSPNPGFDIREQTNKRN
jgi:hypothetical protein